MRILFADDHEMMRASLAQFLQRKFPGVEIVEAGTGGEVMRLIAGEPFGLAILDIDLPDRSGLEVLVDIRRIAPALPVLMLSGQTESEYGLRALKAGAAGFLSKTESMTALEAAVGKVLAGGHHVSPLLGERVAATLDAKKSDRPHDELSEREFQILLLIASGKPVGEIATQLSLSVKTVSTYRSRLLKKMRMSSNAELMNYAFRNQLVR